MLGRKKKELVVRLLKVPLKSFDKPMYHIVVARKRSKPKSRIDKLGFVTYKTQYSFLKIDIKRLNKYLVQRNVRISQNVWKVLGLDDYCHLRLFNKKRK